MNNKPYGYVDHRAIHMSAPSTTRNNQETNERLAILCGYLGQTESLPNYCNDLNAMSEVETWMVGRGYGSSYQAELQAMAGGYLSYHLASASQRARAAILVLEND